jgi:hypothetical protein
MASQDHQGKNEFHQGNPDVQRPPTQVLRSLILHAQSWEEQQASLDRYIPTADDIVNVTKEKIMFHWMQLLALDTNMQNAVVLQTEQSVSSTLERGTWQLTDIARDRLSYVLSVWNKYTDSSRTLVPLPDLPIKNQLNKRNSPLSLPVKRNQKMNSDFLQSLEIIQSIAPDLDITRSLNNAMVKEVFGHQSPVVQLDSPSARALIDLSRSRLTNGFTHRLAKTLTESRWYLDHTDTQHALGCTLSMMRLDYANKDKVHIFGIADYLVENQIDLPSLFLNLGTEEPISSAVQDVLSSIYQVSAHFSVDEVEIEYINQTQEIDFDVSDVHDDDDAEPDVDAEIDDEDREFDDSESSISFDQLQDVADQFDEQKIPWTSIGLGPQTAIFNKKAFLSEGIYIFEDGLLDEPIMDSQGNIFYVETATSHDKDEAELTGGLHTFAGEYTVTYGHLFSSFYFLHMDASDIARTFGIPSDIVIHSLQGITGRLQERGHVHIDTQSDIEVQWVGQGVPKE